MGQELVLRSLHITVVRALAGGGKGRKASEGNCTRREAREQESRCNRRVVATLRLLACLLVNQNKSSGCMHALLQLYNFPPANITSADYNKQRSCQRASRRAGRQTGKQAGRPPLLFQQRCKAGDVSLGVGGEYFGSYALLAAKEHSLINSKCRCRCANASLAQASDIVIPSIHALRSTRWSEVDWLQIAEHDVVLLLVFHAL
jgi:hypothetical protein